MEEIIAELEIHLELAEASVKYFKSLSGDFQRGLTEGNRMRVESLEKLLKRAKEIEEDNR